MSKHERLLALAAPGAGAEVGEPRLLGAVDDPGVDREPLAQLGEEYGRVLGVADGARSERDDPVGLERLVDRDVLADRLADGFDRLGRELVAGVDAAPEPGDGRATLELGDGPVLDLGDQQPGRVRPHVDDRDSHSVTAPDPR